MTTMFSYNQESGVKAGASQYIAKSGAYVGGMTAKWTKSKSTDSKSAFLEFSLKSPEGEANFLSVCYVKKDGTGNEIGENLINAIMGLLKVKSLTSSRSGNDDICPELTGKQIGFVLQKVLYTKNDGSDGFKFEIKLPFSSGSRKTLREALDGLPAGSVDSYAANLSDKDDRRHGAASAPQHSNSGQQRRPADEFEDDIPF